MEIMIVFLVITTKKGPEIGLYNNHLTIRSIKLYADGALRI